MGLVCCHQQASWRRCTKLSYDRWTSTPLRTMSTTQLTTSQCCFVQIRLTRCTRCSESFYCVGNFGLPCCFWISQASENHDFLRKSGADPRAHTALSLLIRYLPSTTARISGGKHAQQKNRFFLNARSRSPCDSLSIGPINRHHPGHRHRFEGCGPAERNCRRQK